MVVDKLREAAARLQIMVAVKAAIFSFSHMVYYCYFLSSQYHHLSILFDSQN
jgi:hypothetical protein